MRWAPIVAMIAAAVGCADAMIARAAGNRATFADILPAICVLAVVALSMIRPRLIYAETGRPLDEREIGLHRQAVAMGHGAIAMLAILICLYMSQAIENGWWTPTHSDDWSNLLQVLLCWLFGAPLAFAHWRTPPPLDEETDQ